MTKKDINMRVSRSRGPNSFIVDLYVGNNLVVSKVAYTEVHLAKVIKMLKTELDRLNLMIEVV